MSTLLHRRPGVAAAVGVTVLAVALAGCSGDKKDDRKSSTSSSTSAGQGTATGGTDQSTSVLGNGTVEAVGTSTSTTYFLTPPATTATLSVGPVVSGPSGTRITWWVTVPDGTSGRQMPGSVRSWAWVPAIVDPVAKKAYQVNLFRRPSGDNTCVCTGMFYAQSQPRYMTAEYPPLPAGLTSVTVQVKGFPALKNIPVTRTTS